MKNNVTATISKISKMLLAFIVVSATWAMATVSAQTFVVKSYDMKISGTSNMHDWKMKAKDASINAVWNLQAGKIADLSGLEFSMPVKGLKSESDLMDSRTYSTLKADKHQKINFKLVSADVTQQGGQYLIKATGNLTIAGVTKSVVLMANGVMNNEKLITVTGSKKIKMSEWQIKPPSFMFGAMKVGDEVTIDFNLKFNG